MSAFYAIRVVDGRHQVGVTTDGRDFAPLPRAAFGKPRDAIRYAEMRQRNVSPLRDGLDDGDFQLIAESAHPDSPVALAGSE